MSTVEHEIVHRPGLDHEPRTNCPTCGALLFINIDTDGNGKLVETVQECRRCRRSRFIVIPKGHRHRTCEVCRRGFAIPIQRGRPRNRCERCR